MAQSEVDLEAQPHRKPTEEEHLLLSRRLRHNPLLDYAASHWGYHARSSGEEPVLGCVLAFLQAPSSMASSIEVQCGQKHFKALKATLLENPALHLAIFFGLELACANILGNKAIGMNDQRNSRKWQAETMECALHCAFDCGNPDIMRLLLLSGTTFSSHNKLCEMLYLAIRRGSFYTAEALLSQNRDVLLDGFGINRELQERGGEPLFIELENRLETFCSTKDHMSQMNNDVRFRRTRSLVIVSDMTKEWDQKYGALRSTKDHVPKDNDESIERAHLNQKLSDLFGEVRSALPDIFDDTE